MLILFTILWWALCSSFADYLLSKTNKWWIIKGIPKTVNWYNLLEANFSKGSSIAASARLSSCRKLNSFLYKCYHIFFLFTDLVFLFTASRGSLVQNIFLVLLLDFKPILGVTLFNISKGHYCMVFFFTVLRLMIHFFKYFCW